MIDLQPSATQDEIVDAVAGFLAREMPIDRLAPKPTPRPNADGSALLQLGELGYLGLGLAEEKGGVGLSAVEEVLVFREFGRNLVTPAVLGGVMGAHLAAAAGRDEAIAGILSGESRVGLAIGAGVRDGEFYLAEAVGADWLVFWTECGAVLIEAAAFVDRQALPSIDSSITLEAASLHGQALDRACGPGDAQLGLRGSLLSAAMQVGMAEAARDITVDYMKIREQFGQPLGAFQAVKHRCADMTVRAAAAWSQTLFAGLEMAELGRGTPFQVAAAKVMASVAGLKNAKTGIQNHGGLGFTGDHAMHLFLKRCQLLDTWGGGFRSQRNAVLNSPIEATDQ